VSEEFPDGVAAFAAGSRIAGYRLEERVGQGGMAVVFRARDERLGRLVALKILAPALAADAAFRHRFIRESRSAAAIDHPHIIPVFEAGEADGILFIAMRYVAGGDAGSLVSREGPLLPGRAAAIISQVASALDAAHEAGLVHRDVKPANMLCAADHVYLSDFGLSKAAMSSTALTGTEHFLGTLDYIAPEQIQGGVVDGRADQYALACAAFELLTGEPPFRRDQVARVMFAQLSEPPPQLAARRPDLTPAVDGVLAKALAKRPDERYATCQEFADSLRAALGLLPYDSGPGLIPTADHPPTQEVARLGDMPTTDVQVPASSTQAPWPAPTATSPAAGPWRIHRVPLLAGVTLLVAAGAAAAALLAAGGSHASASIPVITARSRLPPVTEDVYVVYQGGAQASAQISGQVKDAVSGEVAQLYAQPFPFHHAPVPAGSVILRPAGAKARYAFTVTPSVATRYKVEVFQNSAATSALVSSANRTVYVTVTATSGNGQTCSRPVCHETFRDSVPVPASALATEMAKRWYSYFGLSLGPKNVPPPPPLLTLGAGNPHVTASRQISATEFSFTITFTFRIGNDAYNWNWNACSQDTEAEDGIGLPGHHGCGDQRIPDSTTNYLG
jgi:serine/threonine protein kinase